jgi:hypothetical protein
MDTAAIAGIAQPAENAAAAGIIPDARIRVCYCPQNTSLFSSAIIIYTCPAIAA